MILTNLFLIAFIAVFIIDYSGFIDEMGKMLTKVLASKVPLHIPKPFSCSLCTTFWVGLIYLLCIGKLTIFTLALLGIVCILTPEILSIIYFGKDIINKVFEYLETLLHIFE